MCLIEHHRCRYDALKHLSITRRMGIQRYMSDDFAGALSCFARAMEIDLEQVTGANAARRLRRSAACWFGFLLQNIHIFFFSSLPHFLLQVGYQHQVMTMYLTNIARVHESLGQWDKAMELHLRVIDVAMHGGGAGSLEVSVALEDLAYCCVERGLVLHNVCGRDEAVIRDSLRYLLRAFHISYSL